MFLYESCFEKIYVTSKTYSIKTFTYLLWTRFFSQIITCLFFFRDYRYCCYIENVLLQKNEQNNGFSLVLLDEIIEHSSKSFCTHFLSIFQNEYCTLFSKLPKQKFKTIESLEIKWTGTLSNSKLNLEILRQIFRIN